MARITHVKKAQKSKDTRTCGKCGKAINVGDAYKWVKPNRYGGKWFRCDECPTWQPWELSSSKMAPVWEAQSSASSQLSGLNVSEYIEEETEQDDEGTEHKVKTFNADSFVDDVKQVLTELADEVDSVKDDYQDGYDNIPESLQEGPVAEEIQEKIDALENFVSELQDFDPSTYWSDAVDVEDFNFDDAVESFVSDVVSEADDAVNNFDY